MALCYDVPMIRLLTHLLTTNGDGWMIHFCTGACLRLHRTSGYFRNGTIIGSVMYLIYCIYHLNLHI